MQIPRQSRNLIRAVRGAPGRYGRDGNLRQIFFRSLPAWHWTAVETGATSSGVPDSEYCSPEGAQGWLEYKVSRGWAVTIRPEQVGWLKRRARQGGRCFVAVRRILEGSVDELWLVAGGDAGILGEGGLRAVAPVLRQAGGPSKWDFNQVAAALTR